jgi:hypothetical protein
VAAVVHNPGIASRTRASPTPGRIGSACEPNPVLGCCGIALPALPRQLKRRPVRMMRSRRAVLEMPGRGRREFSHQSRLICPHLRRPGHPRWTALAVMLAPDQGEAEIHHTGRQPRAAGRP